MGKVLDCASHGLNKIARVWSAALHELVSDGLWLP